jgi:hypothetical protein
MEQSGAAMRTLLKRWTSSSTDAKDPLAFFLSDILRFTPVTFGVFILVADVVVDAWLGWHFQVFFTAGPTPGLLQDASALITDFIVNPLLCGVYLWSSHWAADLFRRLRQPQFFDDAERVQNVEAQRQALFRSRPVFILAAILALIGTISQVGSYKGWFPWRTIEGVLYLHGGDLSFFRAPFWFITLYSTVYLIYNAAASVHVISRLFNGQRVRLQLLHPDGCGGLSSLARFAQAGLFLIVPLGALISVSIIQATVHRTLATAYPVWLMLAAYIILAPTLLILPLYAAHQAMVRTKDAELQKITEAYNREYVRITRIILDPECADPDLKEAPVGRDSTEPKAWLTKLEQIKQLYQSVGNDFPTWPLNAKVIRRYTTAVVSPLVPAILSVGIDICLNVLRGLLS